MEIVFINRKFYSKAISIEKLFGILKEEYRNKDVLFTEIENPYPFGLWQIIRGMFYFKKHQKKNKIYHITGDIHWAGILLNPNTTVLTIHDIGRYYELSGLRRFVFYLFWIYLPLKKLKYITTISQKTKDDIVALISWAENKIKVIPNPLTIDIDPKRRRKQSNEPKILIVGTRVNKNIERSLRALTLLEDDIKLIIVGELSPDQEKLVAELSLELENYKFISDKELNNLYYSADILLFPSLFEGFGLPILEGQAAGCIVITSNISPMIEVAGDAAILVDPLDEKSILTGLKKALSLTVREREELINKARSNIKKYEVEFIVRRYMDVYSEIEDTN